MKKRKQVKFRLSEDEQFELQVRASRAGKSVQQYLSDLVADAEKVQAEREQNIEREAIKRGVDEPPAEPPHTFASAPPFTEYQIPRSPRAAKGNVARNLREFNRIMDNIGTQVDW